MRRHNEQRSSDCARRLAIVSCACIVLATPLSEANEVELQQTAVSTDSKIVKTGRAKAQGCTRCHGRDGIARLAQQNDWKGPVGLFVWTRLTALKNGAAHHPIMTEIAGVLSAQDIAEISAWVQSLSAKSK